MFFRVGAVLIQHTKTSAGAQNNFKSSFMGAQWNGKSPACLTINSPINLETPWRSFHTWGMQIHP